MRSAFAGAGAILVGVFTIGCGGQRVINVQENSNPTGFVIGRIVAASDGLPLAGVTVATLGDDTSSTTTDSSGFYRLGPIATGTYTLVFDAGGYLRRTATVVLQDIGSMFPVGNALVTQDVEMARADAVAEGILLTSSATAAAEATIFYDLRDVGYDLVGRTTTDVLGHFRIEGLPGAAFGQNVTLIVAPYDENSDSIPDYTVTSRSFLLFPGFTTFNTITLSPLGVQLIASNVADGEVAPLEPLLLTFSSPVRQSLSTITLYRTTLNVQVAGQTGWDALGTRATFTPVGGPLIEGQSYTLSFMIRATNGASLSNSLAFVVRGGAGVPAVDPVTNFRVTNPTTFDSGLAALTVGWAPVGNATGYRLYGRDSSTASAYLLLGSASSPMASSLTVGLTLFDSVVGDSLISPLGHHNTITLAIVPLDRSGVEGSLINAATLELADGVPPAVVSAQQSFGSADNLLGGTSAQVTYQLTFSEQLVGNPAIQLPHPSTSAVWSWTAANRGFFIITVPPGVDGSGQVSVTLGPDTSDLSPTMPFSGSID